MQTRRTRAAILWGAAGLAWSAMATAKERTWPLFPGVAVEFQGPVVSIHIVPEGNAMAGLHADMKVNGRMLDVYIAPMNFVEMYDVHVTSGDEARIEGTKDGDQVIAHSITTGKVGEDGVFRPNMTIYLGNDVGSLR